MDSQETNVAIQENEPPEGWQLAKLPEFAGINMGQSPPGSTYNQSGEGLPFFQGKADFGDRYPKVRVYCSAPNKVAHTGDILLSIRAPVGPTNVAQHECAIGRGLAAIRPLGGITSEYLLFAIRRIELELSLQGTGTTFSAINRGDLDVLEFPLAPLAEQKRIVVKVEALLARVNASRERLARAPQILKRFRQGVLAAACDGRLTQDWREANSNAATGRDLIQRLIGPLGLASVPSDEDPIQPPDIPESWSWSRCGLLADSARTITYGVIKLGPEVPGGTKTLRSSDVRWLYVDERCIKCIADEVAQDFSRTFLTGGEIVVTVRGTLGGVAVVPKRLAGANVSREVAVVPLHSGLDPQFYAFVIAASPSQAWLSEVSRGVAYTGINIRELKLLPLPVPPFEEQHEIVRRIEALFNLADAIERRVALARKRADKLTQAILAKAFRGELVPTEAELARQEGRDYEPASALLERIRAEPAKHENAGKRSPRSRESSRAKTGRPPASSAEPEVPALKPAALTNGRPVQLLLDVKPAGPGHKRIAKASSTAGHHPFDDIDTDEVMAAFRTTCWGDGDMTQDDLLGAVASQFGYERVGKEIRGRLKNHLRAAVRRKIIARDGKYVYCPTKIFRNYDRGDLVHSVQAVMRPGVEYDRDDVARTVARYLGYSHLSSGIRVGMKSIFNGMLRRGLLDRRGANAIVRSK